MAHHIVKRDLLPLRVHVFRQLISENIDGSFVNGQKTIVIKQPERRHGERLRNRVAVVRLVCRGDALGVNGAVFNDRDPIESLFGVCLCHDLFCKAHIFSPHFGTALPALLLFMHIYIHSVFCK